MCVSVCLSVCLSVCVQSHYDLWVQMTQVRVVCLVITTRVHISMHVILWKDVSNCRVSRFLSPSLPPSQYEVVRVLISEGSMMLVVSSIILNAAVL